MKPGKLRPLREIERDIRKHLAEGKRTLLQSAERARRVGLCLMEAKARLPYGEFRSWAYAKFGWGPSQVTRFMQVPKRWSDIRAQIDQNRSFWGALLLGGDRRLTGPGSAAVDLDALPEHRAVADRIAELRRIRGALGDTLDIPGKALNALDDAVEILTSWLGNRKVNQALRLVEAAAEKPGTQGMTEGGGSAEG